MPGPECATVRVTATIAKVSAEFKKQIGLALNITVLNWNYYTLDY